MKIIKFLATAILLFAVSYTMQAQTQTEKIKVYGNCGTCEKHIEKAAKQAGAEKALWNMDTKVLTVTFDTAKTTNDAIQKMVASAGYDTEKYIGDDKAYNRLDECCQYDRKKSNSTKK